MSDSQGRGCDPPRRALLPAALLVPATLALLPAAAAAVNGVTDAEVVFGMSADLSGPSRDIGRQMRVGIEVAFAARNAQGGVHGRRLSLVAMDDGYQPQRTREVMKELIETRKVFGIVGNTGTATAAVAAPYAVEKGVLFFGACSGSELLRNDPPDRFVFNFRASYWEETATLVRYLVEVRRVRPAQIAFFGQDDAYGDEAFEGVAHMMRKYRSDPAHVLRVSYRRNTTDVAEAVRVLKQNAPRVRAVVMAATYKPAARFVQKVREEGLGLSLASISYVGPTELAEQLVLLGPRYAEGLIVSQVVPLPSSSSSLVLRYRKDLGTHAPAEKPDFVSLEGYVVATLLIEGLQRAGRQLDTDAMIAALESMKGLDLGLGTQLGYGPSEHQASHKVSLVSLDGQGAFHVIHWE